MPLNLKGIPTTSSRGYDVNNIIKINRGLSKLPLEQRAAIIGSIIEESGGNPFAVDKSGTYKGLLQWGADRYVPKSKDPNIELNNQIQYILSTVNNTNGGINWTHGGKGSGYKTLDDAYKTFNNQDLPFKDRFRAFSYGYVRPAGKEDSYNNRLKVAQEVLNRLVVGEQLSKPQSKPIPLFDLNANKFPSKYAEGGSMTDDYSYIDADNRRSNVLLHNNNGLLFDNLGNNYTQSYLDESNVPVVTGRMPRNTSPYFDPFGALTFANAATAPFTSFSPSNIVGSIREARDFPTFMDSFMNQNNGGFFTDEYAREHPYISTLGNLVGDMAVGAAGDKALDVLRNLPNVPAYKKLGYKANKLQKQLGLVKRPSHVMSFDDAYDNYYGYYLDRVFQKAFEKNPSKYSNYENLYTRGEIEDLHKYFKENGFKTPVLYKEGDTYYPMMPGDREYTLFSDNPEYYQFIEETGLPAFEQSTVDKFLDRQMTSLRGVYANNEGDARKFLTETRYGFRRPGNDRLNTNGGLYTSNSQGIAEAFKNPNSKQTIDGYIGRLKMKDDIDRTLPIEQQLSKMRDKVFMTNDNKVGDWALDSRMRKQAIDNGAVAFESRYGRRNGSVLPVTERAYLPTTDNNGINHPVTIEKLDYYPDQTDQHGRWNRGTAGVDYVPEDNELFIPKQLNSTTDYIKYMREMLRKDWVPDELAINEFKNDVYEIASKRVDTQNNLAMQAERAFIDNQNRLNTIKKVGAGLTLTSPLPVAAYMLKENKDLNNQSVDDSFDVVNDYYFNGNNSNSTEARVQQSLAFLKDNDPESYDYLMKRINKKNNSKAFGGSLSNGWDSLSYRDKAEMMRVAIANGITSLPEIKSAYNEYAKGGRMNDWTIEDEAKYRYWRSRLPKNLRDTNDNDYDMRAAYKAGMQPMWNDADKSYHLGSRDPKTGRILKSPHHPTFLKALATDASLGYYPTMDRNGNVYTETWKGNTYASGGYIPSDSIKRRITNWEGSSMKTNRSFEAEAKDFNRVVPTDVRDKLSSQQLDALYSYGYNVGMGKLKERVLPTLTAYTQGKATKEDVQKSMWAAKDSQLRGLTKRRNAEREMFGGNYRTTYDGKNIGVHIDPSSFELPHTFFENINVNIPQMQSPMIEVDPSTIYKAPTIDETLFSSPKPIVDTPVFNPRQDRIEGIQRLNTIMNLMGQSSPFGFLGNDNQGIMSYVNAIYS